MNDIQQDVIELIKYPLGFVNDFIGYPTQFREY